MPAIEKTSLPYGGWPSAITADMITSGSTSRDNACKVGDTVYWQESRPLEQGRTTVVAMGPDGEQRDLLPEPVSTQSKVHEYGGRCWLVNDSTLFYVDKADQRVYRLDPGAGNDAFRPVPLTPGNAGLRFADFCMDHRNRRLIAVCELHGEERDEPANFLAAIPVDGSASEKNGPEILASGNDFYAYPRVSPDGRQLCWISWNHPRMPWEGTSLYRAGLGESGPLENTVFVAGGEDESIFQPAWSPDNTLYFVSDRSGWWNIHSVDGDGSITPHCTMEAEFATPLWALGMSTYGFIGPEKIAALFSRGGKWHLGILQAGQGFPEVVETPCAEMHGLSCAPDGEVFFTGATAVSSGDIFRLPPGASGAARLTDSTPDIDLDNISRPEPVTFPTTGGDEAHGFFYPPANADYRGQDGTLPPLIVMCHGGPTGANHGVLNYKIQYWTSRGFALLDVNYRGSTGYGRAYRGKLDGQWGVADVEDAAAGARHLADRRRIDPDRIIIRGSSAGGYTVLAALTFTDVFKAGASLYGIGDLEALARDTHKFESRYLDNLVGPYPQARDTYLARSPIHHQENLSCPVIFLQGLEDKVVPPNQAESMVDALDRKGIPVAYVTFDDEGHGFRKAENIKTALESELCFYRRVLDIDSPERLPKVEVRNLQEPRNHV